MREKKNRVLGIGDCGWCAYGCSGLNEHSNGRSSKRGRSDGMRLPRFKRLIYFEKKRPIRCVEFASSGRWFQREFTLMLNILRKERGRDAPTMPRARTYSDTLACHERSEITNELERDRSRKVHCTVQLLCLFSYWMHSKKFL